MEKLEELSHSIENFIQASMEKLGKEGVIIGLSGGIDSSVVAFLCVKALGKDKVFGLIMPEKESSPENIRDAEEIAKILRIKHEKIDLTPLLQKIGVYKHIPTAVLKNKFLVEKSFETYMKSKGGRMLHSMGAFGMTTPDRLSQRVTATMLPKLRLRSLLLYYRATLKNFLVVGTTNKTEYLLGHYDKYGDGACDIEPIRELYKTEVKKLARYLEVPEKIIAKPPTHDLLAGFVLTDEKMMGFSFEKVDSILEKIEKGEKEEKIAEELEIEIGSIKELERAIKNQEMYREMPLSPK